MSDWEVEFHPACEAWADRLSQKDSEALLAAIRVLRAEGPSLGRPLVDSVKASRHKNMKELRPGSTGRTEIRVLFAFDLRRQASRGLEGSIQEGGQERRFAMSLKKWEKKVLKAPGADRRVSAIERELRIAAGLAELREDAGVSQRELAKRIGVSQPRVAAIERSENVTIDVLQQYVESLGADLEVAAVKGTKKITLLAARAHRSTPRSSKKVANKTSARRT